MRKAVSVFFFLFAIFIYFSLVVSDEPPASNVEYIGITKYGFIDLTNHYFIELILRIVLPPRNVDIF